MCKNLISSFTLGFIRTKRDRSFFLLKQFGKIVIEYETKLKELVEFVPELANFEDYLCSKFEKGLTL